MAQGKSKGILAIKTIAMPADTNPQGDIFGGWVLSQMDLAAWTIAKKTSMGRAATIAIDAMTFKKPVKIGDVLDCFVDIKKTGPTSMTFSVEAWVNTHMPEESYQVTAGTFVFVAIDKRNRPRPIKEAESPDPIIHTHPMHSRFSFDTTDIDDRNPQSQNLSPILQLLMINGLIASQISLVIGLLALTGIIAIPLAASIPVTTVGVASLGFFAYQPTMCNSTQETTGLTFNC